MQEVVLGPSSRIFLAPCKLPSLGSSWYQGQKKQTWQFAGFARYSASKGRQFRLALPQDDSDERRQYSGQVLFQRYTAQTRDTVESIEQSIYNNVENRFLKGIPIGLIFAKQNTFKYNKKLFAWQCNPSWSSQLTS